MKIIIGVSGASGAPYANRVLEFLATEGVSQGIETHVVFSKVGRLCWNDEVGVDPKTFGLPLYNPNDMTAAFASGSAKFDGMAGVPCSAGQLGRIANGVSIDLIGRAADVCLKERKKLGLVLRESPLSLIHANNMVTLLTAGAVVMPASPNFYSKPTSIDDLLDTVAGRVLDQLGIENSLVRRWEGRF